MFSEFQQFIWWTSGLPCKIYGKVSFFPHRIVWINLVCRSYVQVSAFAQGSIDYGGAGWARHRTRTTEKGGKECLSITKFFNHLTWLHGKHDLTHLVSYLQ